MCEIILPGRGGDGGLPRWVHEGIATYMVGAWLDDDERLMRELVASGQRPGPVAVERQRRIRERASERRTRARRIRLHGESLGAHQHSSLPERAHRPARGQNLRRRVRSDAGGIRRSVPAIRGTPIQACRSLTFRPARERASHSPFRVPAGVFRHPLARRRWNRDAKRGGQEDTLASCLPYYSLTSRVGRPGLFQARKIDGLSLQAARLWLPAYVSRAPASRA